MRDAGVNLAIFRPPKPYAIRRLNNRTHRKLLHRRRARRADRRRRDRRRVDRRRAGPRPLARHARPRPRAGRARPAGRVRGELARGDRRRARRAEVPARARAARRRLHDAGRALVGRRRRHERRGAVLPRDRLRARAPRTSPPRTSPRARRSSRRCATRRERGVAVRRARPRRAHRQGLRPQGRARRRTSELLECGVRIWEYCPTMLHAKTLTIDRRWTSVGSVNFDNRSFQLQDEATLCVSSESFTARARRAVRARPREVRGDRARALAQPLAAREGERALLTLARREL